MNQSSHLVRGGGERNSVAAELVGPLQGNVAQAANAQNADLKADRGKNIE